MLVNPGRSNKGSFLWQKYGQLIFIYLFLLSLAQPPVHHIFRCAPLMVWLAVSFPYLEHLFKCPCHAYKENANSAGFTERISDFSIDASMLMHEMRLELWKNGVERALKQYISDGTKSKGKCPQCGQENMAYQNGCLTCMSCGYSKCG